MSLQQVSGSTFESVVNIPSHLKPWPILGGGHTLALLHAKFWGKSMADEEQEWLNAQLAIPATESEFGLGDREGEERMHGVVEEKMGVDETVVVDDTMDEATTTDPDDDIIPGCYMVDIGIDGFQFLKFWIRAEYIRIFNSIDVYYNTPVDLPQAPCAVVTGQPGIGELVAFSDCFENNIFCIKARVYGSITLYADASPKGSRSFGTSNGAATCSLKRVSTRCLPIFRKLTSNHLSGPWSIPMKPWRVFHRI